MSIIKCLECGHVISDKASTCPNCGAPVGNQEEKQEVKKAHPISSQQKKKGSTTRIVTFLGIALLVIVFIMILSNNPNSIPGVTIKINTPNPVIATERADFANQTLLKLKETVYATIQNHGGDGYVLVNFHIAQAGNNYTRTKSIYIRANQNLDVQETFDEVTRTGGESKYSVDCRAQ